MELKESQGTSAMGGVNSPAIPPGLEALYSTCRQLYPDQLNPLQVTALIKYWLGGPDPLDYISMYANPGDPEREIPPHWHYISFGLSDLHGDGRVHEHTGPESSSGFGFELTFRLRKEPGEKNPPTWPAAIMQSLAKYVFQSDSVFCVGDHVSWHSPLDNSESRIQHMLMGEDPRLGVVSTAHGPVQFIQIIGVTSEELKAAQHWNGIGIIELLKKYPGAGGMWMVTDMRRGESVYEIQPAVAEHIENGIEREGSSLSGVSAWLSWTEWDSLSMSLSSSQSAKCDSDADCEVSHRISEVESEQIKCTLTKGLIGTSPTLPPMTDKDTEGEPEREEPAQTGESAEFFMTRFLEGVHLKINLESGALFPLALRGRLKHGRHFTFKSVVGDAAVTLVTSSVAGAFVEREHPFATKGPWLQILITDEFLPVISRDMADLADPDSVTLPLTFSWPSQKLAVTIVEEH